MECGQACYIASQWWSVMTWSDPGVCMYAFGSTGRVQSEEHRNELLTYIDKECLPLAVERNKKHKCKKSCCPEDGDEPEDCPAYDIEQLGELSEYIKHAPIEPVKATA